MGVHPVTLLADKTRDPPTFIRFNCKRILSPASPAQRRRSTWAHLRATVSPSPETSERFKQMPSHGTSTSLSMQSMALSAPCSVCGSPTLATSTFSIQTTLHWRGQSTARENVMLSLGNLPCQKTTALSGVPILEVPLSLPGIHSRSSTNLTSTLRVT